MSKSLFTMLRLPRLRHRLFMSIKHDARDSLSAKARVCHASSLQPQARWAIDSPVSLRAERLSVLPIRPMTYRSSFSSMSDGSGPPQIKVIDKGELLKVIDAGRSSESVIIDVRTESEILQTGSLSPWARNIPIEVIAEALSMDEDTFEDLFHFQKPSTDTPLIFSCAAGVRSYMAAQMAVEAGYVNVYNYQGGANEFFYG